MWTHSTAIDTSTTWRFAQHVWLVPSNPDDPDSPKVPTVQTDIVLQLLAGYVLCLDVVDRLNAYSVLDLSGAQFPNHTHYAFAALQANPAFDVDAALNGFIAGEPARFPSLPCPGEFYGLIDVEFRDARGTVGAILPEMRRAASGIYSQANAVRRGSLLNQARAVQHARSTALDAMLAASCAANWTAARVARLAALQVMHPERGYT